LRRKITIITALCMLVGATAAYAALNTYSSAISFSKGAGSKKKPVPVSFVQTYGASNADSSKAAAVLIDIKTSIYGLVADGKDFPTCSPSKMVTQKSDSFCPKKSKFATGTVNALLGDPTLSKSNRVPCNPGIDVFNGGAGKLWFFFTAHSATQCAGLTTGQTAPYPGTVKQQGKFEVTDVPLPPDVSTKVANVKNFYGSLIKEVLHWAKITTTVKGKTVGANVSVACLNGKRPYKVAFTATDGHTKETKTVTGSAKC
jgi:hypothetical protein